MILRPAIAHCVAMIVAVLVASKVYKSTLAKSDVQFLAPLFVIMLSHMLWVRGAGRT